MNNSCSLSLVRINTNSRESEFLVSFFFSFLFFFFIVSYSLFDFCFVLVSYIISFVLFIFFSVFFCSHNANKKPRAFFSHHCLDLWKMYICFPDAYRKRNFCTFYSHVGTSFDTYYDIQRICKWIYRRIIVRHFFNKKIFIRNNMLLFVIFHQINMILPRLGKFL